MAKPIVEMDSVFTFCNRRYDMQLFADTFCGGDLDQALATVQQLCDTGRASIERNTSKEQRAFERTASEVEWKAQANQHDQFEEQHKDFIADKKREGRATYAEIKLDYPNLLKAQEHQNLFLRDLRIAPTNTKIEIAGGLVHLKFFNVTDAELNYMKRLYQTDRVIGGVINAVDSGAQKVTGVVDYAANKIAAPTAQVVTRAGVSILKTVGKTMAKVTSGLVTASIQGTKQAAHEIRNDAEVLRAGRELLEVKDAATRLVANHSRGGGGGGITITQ